jgi:ribonuclease D
MATHEPAYELVTEPGPFRASIAAWSREPRLWLDTEIADWFTRTPRLSLLQVRDGSGRIWVVDVLETRMRQVVEEDFIHDVMSNRHVEKWAHYARFEREFLGQDRVVNLNCTFLMARSIPYYRLPLRSLSLAALADHLLGAAPDKELQKADWGGRPLSPVHLEYAALDTEWCYRVHDALLRCPGPPDVTDDDPRAIAARYLQILAPLRGARAIRNAIRDAVKEFMVRQGVARFSRFSLQARTTYSTDLATLMDFALTTDPSGYFDLDV